MAKATYIQKGNNIDYLATADIGYMDIVPLTSRIGVALEDIPAGNVGSVTLTGVYEMPAATALAITVGDLVYYNVTNGNITKTAADVPAGVAVESKTSSATTVRVKIG